MGIAVRTLADIVLLAILIGVGAAAGALFLVVAATFVLFVLSMFIEAIFDASPFGLGQSINDIVNSTGVWLAGIGAVVGGLGGAIGFKGIRQDLWGGEPLRNLASQQQGAPPDDQHHL